MTRQIQVENTRRQALTGGIALIAVPALVLPRGAFATPKFTYKFGSNVPATRPLNVRAMEATEQISKDSRDHVPTDVYPNNQLGNDLDMHSQLSAGGLEFLTVSGVNALVTSGADYVESARPISGLRRAGQCAGRHCGNRVVWAAVIPDRQGGRYPRDSLRAGGDRVDGRRQLRTTLGLGYHATCAITVSILARDAADLTPLRGHFVLTDGGRGDGVDLNRFFRSILL